MDFIRPLSENNRKQIRSLHRKKNRDELRLFLAEGPTVLNEVLLSSFTVHSVVVQSDSQAEFSALLYRCHQQRIDVYSEHTRHFAAISETQSPQGILAVVEYPAHMLQPSTGSVVILDGIADPGNAGTIVRSAHFFGYDRVVLSTDSVDPYNSKVVRSSMGSLFHLSVEVVELMDYLQKLRNSHTIYAAVAHDGTSIHNLKTQAPCALVVGSEAHGIRPAVAAMAHHLFSIEGTGGAESLNAAVAAAISLYHFAPRQA